MFDLIGKTGASNVSSPTSRAPAFSYFEFQEHKKEWLNFLDLLPIFLKQRHPPTALTIPEEAETWFTFALLGDSKMPPPRQTMLC
jgi:hypothetical protein